MADATESVVIEMQNKPAPQAHDIPESSTEKKINPFHGGTIKFSGFGRLPTSDNPKFIKVDEQDVDYELIWKTLTVRFGLDYPKLIVSVNGGAKQMKPMTQKLLVALKKGLTTVATTTNTWLITSGLNVGVAKLVGDAIREYSLGISGEHTPVLIGIATWGSVYARHALEKKDDEEITEYLYHYCRSTGKGQASLDPNHTHFFLYDDGSEKAYNREVEFRTELERRLLKDEIMEEDSFSVPVVQVVIEGGKKTIETTYSALEKGMATILIKGSGRCADFLCELLKGTTEASSVSEIEEQIENRLSAFITVWSITDTEFASYKEKLSDILQKRRNLIYVFSVDDADKKLDYAILQAVIENSSLSAKGQLSLAMDMDCCDVATDLFSKGVWVIDDDDMDEKMVTALKEGQTEFVKLFFNHGVSIEQFLNEIILFSLYEHASGFVREVALNRAIEKTKERQYDSRLLLIGRLISKCTGNVVSNPYTFVERLGTVARNRRKLCPVIYPPRRTSGQRLYTEHDLFLWALMVNRRDLVEIFWMMGKDHIGGALTACGILRRKQNSGLESRDLELASQLEEDSRYFEKLACDILSKAYERNRERTHELLLRKLPYYGDENLLSLAKQSQCFNFMSHAAVQAKMDRIWMGQMNPDESIWKVVLNILVPLIFIRLVFPLRQDDTSRSGKHSNSLLKKTKNRFRTRKRKLERMDHPWENVNYFKAVYDFYHTPFTKFVLNTTFNVIFLLLMSYLTMIDLKPYPSNYTNSSTATELTCKYDFLNLKKCISIVEFIIWIWVFTLLLEEIRQIFGSEHQSLYKKLKSWWSSGWNRFDATLYILFAIVISFRFLLPNDYFQWTRNLYAVIMALFFLRFMQTYYVNRVVGPKVVMISKMMKDIQFFISIFIIFLIAYGTAAQALMNPNSELDWNLIKNIFYMPYFQVYGELSLDTLQEKSNRKTILVIVLFSVYLVLTNILMINLLIAMFGYTFANIQEMSVNIWAFKRYKFVNEYVDRPVLPPPLIILPFGVRMIRFIIRLFSPIPSSKQDFQSLRENDALPKRRETGRWKRSYSEVIGKRMNENRKMSAFEQQCTELVLAERSNKK